MKTSNSIKVLCALALLTMVAGAANLVPNASFEDGTGTSPDDWSFNTAGSGGVIWHDSDAYQGSKCVELHIPTAGSGDEANLQSIRFSADGNTKVYWSFAYKFPSSNPSGTPRIQLMCRNSGGSWLGEDNFNFSSSAVTNMGGWLVIPKRTYNLPSGTDILEIRISADIFENFQEYFRIDMINVDIEPTQQTSNIESVGIGDTSIDLSWTDGSGVGRLIVCKQGDAPASGPVYGTDYTANSTFGNGDSLGGGFVVYKDTDNSVTIDGLTANTEYYFQAYEYNNNTIYNTAAATDNPNSFTTTPEPGMFFGIIALGLSIIRKKV